MAQKVFFMASAALLIVFIAFAAFSIIIWAESWGETAGQAFGIMKNSTNSSLSAPIERIAEQPWLISL